MRARSATVAGAAVLTVVMQLGPAWAASQRPAYARPGPFAAGVTTLNVGGIPVDVWYPAERRSVHGHRRASYRISDWVPPQFASILASIPPGAEPVFRTDAYRGVPASKQGPFPLVTFAHGLGGFRDQSTFLTTHLASWGFVVAAPDLPESDLAVTLGQPRATPGADAAALRAAADAVRAASKQPGGVLSGTVRRGPIAAIGHSRGVYASIQLANGGGVAGYIALDGSRQSGFTSGEQPDVKLPATPAMYILASEGLLGDYGDVPAPKRLVLEPQATHLTAFTDVCRIGERNGGLVEIARRAGLTQLAALLDAFLQPCTLYAGELPSARLQPVTAHFVTAQLRFIFGLDKHPVALDVRSAHGFPGVNVTIATGQYRPPKPPPGSELPSG